MYTGRTCDEADPSSESAKKRRRTSQTDLRMLDMGNASSKVSGNHGAFYRVSTHSCAGSEIPSLSNGASLAFSTVVSPRVDAIRRDQEAFELLRLQFASPPQQDLGYFVPLQDLALTSRLVHPSSLSLLHSQLVNMSPVQLDRNFIGAAGVGFGSSHVPLSYFREVMQRSQIQSVLLGHRQNHTQRAEASNRHHNGVGEHVTQFVRGLEALQQLGTGQTVLAPSSPLLSTIPRSNFVAPQSHNGASEQPYQNQSLGTTNRGLDDTTAATLVLAIPGDHGTLNEQQIFLRQQIEVFRATVDDIMSHTRGRNKAVVMGQVGLRCRHCGHLPVEQRRKGSTYFPSSIHGIYQAAQNMSVEHLQSGVCQEMPSEIQNRFASFGEKRAPASGAGRPYWAETGRQLGLVDTEEGIRFAVDIRHSVQRPEFGVF